MSPQAAERNLLQKLAFHPLGTLGFSTRTCRMYENERETRYISPGTKVRYDGFSEEEGGPEYGIVIHCWEDGETGAHDCYVAFFGASFPSGKPQEKPYVLRYAAGALNVLA